VLTLIIVASIIGTYVLFKSRKNGGTLIGNVLRSGKPEAFKGDSDGWIKVILVQQLLNDSNDNRSSSGFGFWDSAPNALEDRRGEIERQKQRILAQFEE